MDYPITGNVSLGSVTGNIKLYVNEGGVNNLSGIGYNNNSMTFGVNQSIFAIPEMVINQIGDVSIIGNVNTGGNLVVNSTTASTSTTIGALRVSGGAGIVGNIFLGGNLITGGDLSCNGNIIVGPRTASISTTTGALKVAGGVGIVGNIFLGGNLITGGDLSCNGNIIVGPTTASISTTSGALRVAGGAGIVGNLNIGGFSRFAVDSSFNGNIQLTQSNNPLWFVSNNASTINSTLASGTDVGIFYGTTNPTAAGLVISPRGAGGGIKLATDGKVGINNANPSYSLDVTGSIRASTFLNVGAPTTLASTTGAISAQGQITGLSFNATSDYRMKQKSQPLLITRSIDLLKPVEYDLSGGSHDMGFLAHEVQEVLPFLVRGEKDGPGMQSMNYNGFIALLVKEVQDLKKENRELIKMKTVQEQQTQIQQQQQSQINSLQEQIKLLLLLRSEEKG